MSTLPTREEAELADEFDSALWSDEWEMAADLVRARADGTLQTEQEWRDSLTSPMAISVIGHRKMHGGHWELTGHSSFKWPSKYGTKYLLIPFKDAALGDSE